MPTPGDFPSWHSFWQPASEMDGHDDLTQKKLDGRPLSTKLTFGLVHRPMAGEKDVQDSTVIVTPDKGKAWNHLDDICRTAINPVFWRPGAEAGAFNKNNQLGLFPDLFLSSGEEWAG